MAPSTQNQAMNALVFLYKHVLKQTLEQGINAIRASRKVKIPVVMTREEVASITALMDFVNTKCRRVERFPSCLSSFSP